VRINDEGGTVALFTDVVLWYSVHKRQFKYQHHLLLSEVLLSFDSTSLSLMSCRAFDKITRFQFASAAEQALWVVRFSDAIASRIALVQTVQEKRLSVI
jgi:hypothetical protein